MSAVPPTSGSPGLGPALVLCVVSRQRVGFTTGDWPHQPRGRGLGQCGTRLNPASLFSALRA